MDFIVYLPYYCVYEGNQLPQLLIGFNWNDEVDVLALLGLSQEFKVDKFSYHIQFRFRFVFYL